MNTITNENIRPFDVDGTLIFHPSAINGGRAPLINVYDPVTKRYIKMRPNHNMARLLREEKQRGSFILVWSRGGKEWARNVIIAMDLVACVDLVMSKPIVYFDDVPVKKWMKERVFIGPNEKYKP
jgi:hypothetical protein